MFICSSGLYHVIFYPILRSAFLSNIKWRFGRVCNLPLIVFLYSKELKPYDSIVEWFLLLGISTFDYWFALNYLSANSLPDFITFSNYWEKNDFRFSRTDTLAFFSADRFLNLLFYNVTDWNLCLPRRSMSRLYWRSLTSFMILLDQVGLVFLPTVLKTSEVPVLLKISESGLESRE